MSGRTIPWKGSITSTSRSAGYPPLYYFKSISNFDAPILDRLNVRFLLQTAGDPPRSVKWRPVYSGIDGVVLENRDAVPRISPSASPGSPAAACLRVADYVERTNTVDFRAQVTGTAPLAIVASFVQDGGWRGELDSGRRLPLRREGLLIGMDLPPGNHRVRLRYTPPGALAGMSVSTVSAAGLLIATWFRRGRRETRPGESEAGRREIPVDGTSSRRDLPPRATPRASAS